MQSLLKDLWQEKEDKKPRVEPECLSSGRGRVGGG